MNEDGLPVHPAYTGIHYMGLESSVDACQDKVCDGLVGFLSPLADTTAAASPAFRKKPFRS